VGEDMCLDIGVLGEEDSADIGEVNPEFSKEWSCWCGEEEEEEKQRVK
jgi:hypothetical protein